MAAGLLTCIDNTLFVLRRSFLMVSRRFAEDEKCSKCGFIFFGRYVLVSLLVGNSLIQILINIENTSNRRKNNE